MIGAYAAAMGGVDAVIFTAGVGENGPETARGFVKGLEFMGIKIDPEKNKVRGEEADRLRRRRQGQGPGHPHQRGADDRHGHRRHRQGLSFCLHALKIPKPHGFGIFL